MPTYVSAEGLEKLKEEYQQRKTVTRREIAKCIESAKELGDLSENFEYHEAKERQAVNESRIVELEGMIKDAVVIEEHSGGETIAIGSQFVAQSDGDKRVFQLVGSSEADPMAGKISNESPIGRAFIGRRVGDEVEVNVPSGVAQYTVVSIK